MPEAVAHIGTSGWNYKDWKASFYPEGLKAADWLSYFAKNFKTVEVNSSFYRIPTEKSVKAWQESVPSNFLFAVKLWRGITHYRKLVRSEGFLDSYFRSIDHIKTRNRAPLLIQLPPNQRKDIDKLDRFLDLVRERSPHRWKVVVEFRDNSWLSDDVYRMMDRQQAAVCLHDMPGKGDANEPNNAKFVYVRRHGTSNVKYHGGYTAERLKQDAADIRRWLREGKNVFVYFNNDVGGHAVRDARKLKELVDG